MLRVNQNNNVRMSQVALLIVITLAGSKFINIPTVIAKETGRDGWITLIFLFVLDIIQLVALLFANKLNKNRLFIDEILTVNFGKIITKVIFAVYFVFFMVRILDLATVASDVFSTTLTLETNWLGFVIPLLVFLVYAVIKGFRPLARTVEIIAVPIILSAVFMIALSVPAADLTEIKPILADGITPVLSSVPKFTFWFADSLFIMFLLGRINSSEHSFIAPLTALVSGAALTVLLYVVFYSLFGELAENHTGAMEKVSQFNAVLTSNGRLDWLTLIFWMLSLFIKLALMSFCAIRAFDGVFFKEGKSPSVVGVIAFAVIVIVTPLLTPLSSLINRVFSSLPIALVMAVFQYALPIVLPFLILNANRRERLVA